MLYDQKRLPPGRVRDAIIEAVQQAQQPLSIKEIIQVVQHRLGDVPTSSIRSYLRLNTPTLFVRESRGFYSCALAQTDFFEPAEKTPPSKHDISYKKIGRAATLFHADCFDWLEQQQLNSLHAVVTDPPYGLFEYTEEQVAKLRDGHGGVWRIPPLL